MELQTRHGPGQHTLRMAHAPRTIHSKGGSSEEEEFHSNVSESLCGFPSFRVVVN